MKHVTTEQIDQAWDCRHRGHTHFTETAGTEVTPTLLGLQAHRPHLLYFDCRHGGYGFFTGISVFIWGTLIFLNLWYLLMQLFLNNDLYWCIRWWGKALNWWITYDSCYFQHPEHPCSWMSGKHEMLHKFTVVTYSCSRWPFNNHTSMVFCRDRNNLKLVNNTCWVIKKLNVLTRFTCFLLLW